MVVLMAKGLGAARSRPFILGGDIGELYRVLVADILARVKLLPISADLGFSYLADI